jgi:hypothetical protein
LALLDNGLTQVLFTVLTILISIKITVDSFDNHQFFFSNFLQRLSIDLAEGKLAEFHGNFSQSALFSIFFADSLRHHFRWSTVEVKAK